MDNNLRTWGLYRGKEYLSVDEATALAVGLHPDQVVYVESRNSNYDVLHDLFYKAWMYDCLGSDDCHSFFTTEIKNNSMRFRLSTIGQEIKQSVFKDWLTSIDYQSDYFHGEEGGDSTVNNKQSRREEIIKDYLSNKTTSVIKKLALIDIWLQLSNMDSSLFPETSQNRTISDCFTQCRKHGIEFPELDKGAKNRNLSSK